MKLLAIDGNSLINRAYYGIRLLSTKDGKHTNAIFGFINMLHHLLDTENPDCVAVAFDIKSPTFRHKKYAEYKAGRHSTPEELLEQFPVIKQWLALAGFHCIELEGYEADDILGTLSKAAKESGNACVIATGDRDSLQLVSDNTRVLLASTKMGKTETVDYTKELLFEKYGLTPSEMIELKSLMGDSSDNIPGVAGIGEKTASDLIRRFHSIDYIYENLDTLDIKDSVRLKLANGKESAYLSKFLGTICLDAPIDTEISSYKIKERNTKKLSVLMTELELFSIMKKMGIPPAVLFDTKDDEPQKASFEVGSFSDFDGKACDIVEIDGAFYGISGGKVFVCSNEQIESILKNDAEKRVYDLKNLSKRYTVNNVTFDAMLAGYVCNPSASDYSLPSLSAKYCKKELEIKGDFTESERNAALFSLACDGLYKELESTEQLELFKTIELPLAMVLGEMEQSGFLVDKEGLALLGEELTVRIAEIENEIYSLAGEKFNINSPKQLGEMLFVKLQLPAKKKTKSGFSTNAEVLEELRYDYPIVELVLKYRQHAKLKSTYCDGLLNAVSSDGRIHSTFNQTEARTGRISSLEPNLQNIPVRSEEGKKLRKYFVAKEGFVLCDADYSQIELRVLASIAEDEVMIDAFKRGIDIHTATAAQVFNLPEGMVLPIMRSRAKAVNFGIVYGIGAHSLSKDIGVPFREAKGYIDSYLATYKGVANYMERVIADAKENGYVTTFFGRRRYLPELSSSNGMIKSFGERVARNAPIQGTAADIIKLAMINVNNRLKKELPTAKLILQVHDELIVECPEGCKEEASRILEEEMQNAVKMKVDLLVDAHCGKDWLEAKG